jgi:GT2 family glycosyltransferase
MKKVGIVVIGRNEGERLRACLGSLLGLGLPVVYADSASQDGSAAMARSLGCEVVEVDPSLPLGAARGRNEGFRRLSELHPELEAVQFVDGDCVLSPTWIDRASGELATRPDVAVCCGRLREENPEASVYNRLCDLEWKVPPGDVASCGGIALMRTSAFQAVGGFDPSVPAGEEPELCLRLRRAGWKIARLGDDMGRHDAAMTSFRQWWARSLRGGRGSAIIARRPGGGDPAAFRRNASALLWGLGVPLLAAAAAWPTRGLSLLLLAAYPLLAIRIAWGRRRGGDSWGDAWRYSLFCILGKVPHLLGWLRGRRERGGSS